VIEEEDTISDDDDIEIKRATSPVSKKNSKLQQVSKQ